MNNSPVDISMIISLQNGRYFSTKRSMYSLYTTMWISGQTARKILYRMIWGDSIYTLISLNHVNRYGNFILLQN